MTFEFEKIKIKYQDPKVVYVSTYLFHSVGIIGEIISVAKYFIITKKARTFAQLHNY